MQCEEFLDQLRNYKFLRRTLPCGEHSHLLRLQSVDGRLKNEYGALME